MKFLEGSMKQELMKIFVFAVAVFTVPVFFKGGYIVNVLVFVGIYTILAVALNCCWDLPVKSLLVRRRFLASGHIYPAS
jgi:hypothetical protein